MNSRNTIPQVLMSEPAPILEKRYFSKREMYVWIGKADLDDISGWVENPRLRLELEKYQASNANATPGQEEILEIMKSVEEFELSDLVKDVRDNGVRTPLILNFQGTLLDGNRRFFASKQLQLEQNKGASGQKVKVKVPVIVLTKEATQEDEDLVLWHENFYPALKKEWPDYVRAQYIVEALTHGGLDEKAVAERFGWPKTKVRETKRIMELIDDYISYVCDPDDGFGLNELQAKADANKKYQLFNEAQKSLWEPLKQNVDFCWQFFRWIHENKLRSFQEVRVAYSAWQNPDYAQKIESGNALEAKTVVASVTIDKNQSKSKVDASLAIEKFATLLESLKVGEIQQLTVQDGDRLKRLSLVASKIAQTLSAPED
jgi:hypothetical protein